MSDCIRNIAIVAHVDHGKTTLVDQLLKQTGSLESKDQNTERIMDSNSLEKERGITILAKHTSVDWKNCTINLIDTPGHADFGGEVERVLAMADAFLLVVDATDGPMPQTRFVTQKAFAHGLSPVVVINKIDRPSQRVDWVIDQILDLFLDLDASEEQLEFPIIYASALQGYCGTDPNHLSDTLAPLLDTIIEKVPAPKGDPNQPLQVQIAQLDYNPYVGIMGIGRIKQGRVQLKQSIAVYNGQGQLQRVARLEGLHRQEGLKRLSIEEAKAGEIVTISGLGALHISDTLCDPDHPAPLPALEVDEPTVSIRMSVNSSPFAGKEGKLLTSRQIWERLCQEKLHNVALQISETDDPDTFLVSGRGELHLSILIETMRREGFELSISRPKVIFKSSEHGLLEPMEELLLELLETDQGPVMAQLGERKAQLQALHPDGKGRVRLTYTIPSRGLIGFRNMFLTLTSGNGVICSRFLSYEPKISENFGGRSNGVLISNGTGKALSYALFGLQARGTLMIEHGNNVYEGQIIGIHSRDNDLTVNCLQGKKLTNIRAAGKDTALILSPPLRLSLEQALEFIDDDELVEVTPLAIRIRKRYLTESDRKRFARHSSTSK